jgi:hypothetical protein
MTPIAQEITPRIYKWDCIKLISFCTVKENNYQNKETAYKMGEQFLPAFL